MATFECKVYQLTVAAHPNADKLELAQVGDYISCVGKGLFKTGDKAVFIPDQAIVPENILTELGLVGRLAGAKKNRVKPATLRGVLSQGLCYPVKDRPWELGQDVQKELGIVKYEPPIPAQLAGQVGSTGLKVRFNFDIEDIKKYPNVFQDGEQVVITEKIHGTCTIIGLVPKELRQDDLLDGKLFVSSKGPNMAPMGIFLKDVPENEKNSYLRVAKKYRLSTKMVEMFGDEGKEPVWLLGETFGSVQSGSGYSYGINGDVDFRAFGIKVGNRWLNYDHFIAACYALGVKWTPVLYRGPFSREVVRQFTDGEETVSGTKKHIREGVVILADPERFDPEIHRVILKSVSAAYLGKTTGEEIS